MQLLLCRECHDWVGRNPHAAVDAGWALWAHRPNPGEDGYVSLGTVTDNEWWG